MLGENIPQVNWPACGEIDIMEHINNEQDVHGTIHMDSNGHQFYGSPSPNIDVTQYHVYSVEWDKDAIKWFVDGTCETLLGSQAVYVSKTGGGNHPTVYSFNLSQVSLANSKLRVKIHKVSGADAVMCYNTNDFPTKLVTP